MNTAAMTLARFTQGLRFEDIPDAVRARAIACITDTIACSVYGSRFPWSAITARHAASYGTGGSCTILGVDGPKVSAPCAALANGCSAHAFEQDSLRYPGAGVHPGATLVPALIAACEDAGASGKAAVTAFVAGCEVLFRIGAATHHSCEKLGFHAPGLTGPYGATAVAGAIYGLSDTQLTHAFGIAGSMSAGLLAFTKSQEGSMVKRLHMGRACESGIVAAKLAADGYTGPETILEGRFGFLEAYCRDPDPDLLTSGLGETWESLKICMKRYSCHVIVQASIQALRELQQTHGFSAADVVGLTSWCNEKVLSHHDIRHPENVMMAQYSAPFCMALALHRDPENPDSFDASALEDASIARVCQAIELRPVKDLPSTWSARLSITLRDGTQLNADAATFKGMPVDPLSAEDLRRRFIMSTRRRVDASAASRWYEKLLALTNQATFPLNG